ncbi:putative metallopeptidase [Moorella sp. E306M]|uniref:putative metallopeptidase n=1 Tax=Moorella sp. E306M TaxID=2572683 RepID=UPI0010FFAD4A|nr:putative metallopeptidase [Moorella sp. E306M]GEA17771.1 hypothetical protein E306M_09050 [Moorella sp. E306M]GEA17840.1 hypothetical protein E306M_09740 [Moorella sp. E306M]
MDIDTSRLLVLPEWGGKYVINEAYRPIAEALVKKYPELRFKLVDEILFVDNTEDKGKQKNKYKNAQIGKIPEKYREIITQLTGRSFSYIMEFYKRNIETMSREQIIALVYHELRHIGADGDIILHDIEDWANMHYKLGPDWASTMRGIPNLLDEGVDWDSITGPSLFNNLEPDNLEQPRLRAVK